MSTLTNWLDCSFSALGLPLGTGWYCPSVIPGELLKASLNKTRKDQPTSSTPNIKNEMPPGRSPGHGRPSGMRQFQHHIATIKEQLRNSNTGQFSKQSTKIRLPPHKQHAKVFRILFSTQDQQIRTFYNLSRSMMPFSLSLDCTCKPERSIHVLLTALSCLICSRKAH